MTDKNNKKARSKLADVVDRLAAEENATSGYQPNDGGLNKSDPPGNKSGLPDTIPTKAKEPSRLERAGFDPAKILDVTDGNTVNPLIANGDYEFHVIDPKEEIKKAFKDAGFSLTSLSLEKAVFKVTGFPQLPGNCKKVAEKLKEIDFHGLKFHSFGGPGEIYFQEVK